MGQFHVAVSADVKERARRFLVRARQNQVREVYVQDLELRDYLGRTYLAECVDQGSGKAFLLKRANHLGRVCSDGRVLIFWREMPDPEEVRELDPLEVVEKIARALRR